MNENEFEEKLKNGEIEEIKTKEQEPAPLEGGEKLELEDYQKFLEMLRQFKGYTTSVPTDTPKTFLDQIRFYVSGSTYRLYFYIKDTWKDITDHSELDGLADDDHTQYLLRNILTAQGDIFIRGVSVIERLAPGTSGQFLKTQGAGANPIWATLSAAFTLVTEVTLTSASDYIEATGLDLDTHKFYKVVAMLGNVGGAATNIALYFNSNTTNAVYHTQILTADNTTVAGARANNPIIGTIPDDGNAMLEFIMSRPVSGDDAYYKLVGSGGQFIENGDNVPKIKTFNHQFDIRENVTQIRLASSAVNFPIGTKLFIFRPLA